MNIYVLGVFHGALDLERHLQLKTERRGQVSIQEADWVNHHSEP